MLDTAGVFARNADTWSTVMHAWYHNFTDYQKYPKRIFYPKASFPAADTKVGALLEGLVKKLEKFLGTKREPIDIFSQWEKTHPVHAPSNVSDLLNTVCIS